MKTKEEIVESHFGSDFHEVSQPCCLVHICNAMEEYAKAYHEDKTRWISVEERLPERSRVDFSQKVLTLSESGAIEILRYDFEFERWNSMPNSSDIVAWQPLPKLTQNKV